MSFIHLHNHSYYSILQSPSSPEAIANKAKDQGCNAVGLTDLGTMYGVIEFYKECKSIGIKPIIGMDAYISRRSMLKKETHLDGKPYSLVLLAENNEGYENLLKLSTAAHLEGMYYKPRIDLEILERYKKGLIALSGSINGEIPQSILENPEDKRINEIIKKYTDIFGKKNFFLQIAYHPNLPGQMEVNEKLIELSKYLNIPLVVGQGAYYVEQDEAEAQDVLFCTGMNKNINDPERQTMIDENYSLIAPDEIISFFEEVPESIENTVKIAERCNIKFDLGSYHIPEFNTKNYKANSPIELLRYECIKGLNERYPQFKEYLEKNKFHDFNMSTLFKNQKEEIENKNSENIENEKTFSGQYIANRFETEFEVIKQMGFESYFLMVWDYIKWTKRQGILVGPGRGSGAGSIIAYALKITNLEPLRYTLLFERFLNSERISMPDFDIDFQDDRRLEVIDYVTEKYGTDHVAQISTFGTMAARAAIKDVGRVFGASFEKMNMFAKLIPDKPGTKLKEAWGSEEDLRKAVSNDTELQKIWEIAQKLEGCVRHISVHACAVVISEKPLNKYTALQHPPKDDKTIITQLSAKSLESLGLLKMDFLGLKNLTILDTALKIIKRTTGRTIDIDNITMDDEKTLELFQKGETTGVFQFESAGMKRYLKDLKPTKFEDLIAMNSLYRPGPMDFIPDFINRKHEKIHVSYPHACLEKILKPTYGIAVYQEQILQIAQAFSGYTLGQADILRRAIGKKIAEEIQDQRKTFIEKAIELDRNKDTAEYIYDKIIVPFAGYGFNKSHSAAYSMIAYQTAYLKAYYPTEFMAALLTSDQSNTDRIAIEIEECRQMGIDILPPSVNESRFDFTVTKNRQIRFGLNAIKNLGDSCINAIIEARGKEQIKFFSLEEFLKKIDYHYLNKKNMEALIKSGALDELEERKIMLDNLDLIIDYSHESDQKKNSGQIGLFDDVKNSSVSKLILEESKPASFSQKLAWEKEFLGLFVSAHPLSGLEKYWENKFSLIKYIEAKSVGKIGKFAGMISNLRILRTKNDDKMATFILEDPTGKIIATIFPKVFSDYQKKIDENNFIILSGKIDVRNNEVQIIADKIMSKDIEELRRDAKETNLFDEDNIHVFNTKTPIITKEDIKDAKREPWILEIPEKTKKEDLELMKKLFNENPGKYEVILLFPNKQKITITQKINLTKTMKSHISQILYGPDKKRQLEN